jgi:hypothetical protein
VGVPPTNRATSAGMSNDWSHHRVGARYKAARSLTGYNAATAVTSASLVRQLAGKAGSEVL